MPNMSYCRFENTYIDIIDCIAALEDGDIESESEKLHARLLLERILDYCLDIGIIKEYDNDLIIKIVNNKKVKKRLKRGFILASCGCCFNTTLRRKDR